MARRSRGDRRRRRDRSGGQTVQHASHEANRCQARAAAGIGLAGTSGASAVPVNGAVIDDLATATVTPVRSGSRGHHWRWHGCPIRSPAHCQAEGPGVAPRASG
jgi:hypothetical protein